MASAIPTRTMRPSAQAGAMTTPCMAATGAAMDSYGAQALADRLREQYPDRIEFERAKDAAALRMAESYERLLAIQERNRERRLD